MLPRTISWMMSVVSAGALRSHALTVIRTPCAGLALAIHAEEADAVSPAVAPPRSRPPVSPGQDVGDVGVAFQRSTDPQATRACG